MSRGVITCHASDSVAHCAGIMRAKGLSCLPVIDTQGLVVGIVTDRDLTLRVLADLNWGADPLIGQVMSTDLVTCAPRDSLISAEEKMVKAKKSRILVLDRGACAGMITLSDLARVEEPDRVGEIVRFITAA